MPVKTHYIRCIRCGHLNPFKTEYLTLCESCGRKLENNFPDWQKNHPEKTVFDFQKEVCATDTEPSASSSSQKNNRQLFTRGVFAWAIAVLCGLFLGALIWLPDKEDLFMKKKVPNDILSAEWIWHSTGMPPMLVSLPAKPDKQSPIVPAVLTEFVEQAESYRYRPSSTLSVMVDYYRFKQGVAPNPEPVAHAVMKQMVEKNEIRLASYKESPSMYLSARGTNIEGAFHENGKLRQFRFVIYTYRNAAYVVRSVYRNTDPDAAKAAEKIIDSVEIDTEMKGV
jgi:hypothetical protein